MNSLSRIPTSLAELPHYGKPLPYWASTNFCSEPQKILEPSRRRQVVDYLHGSYRVSERRACRVARLNRGTFRYRGHKDPRTALRMRIREIAQARVRYGYRKIRVLLNREGWEWVNTW